MLHRYVQQESKKTRVRALTSYAAVDHSRGRVSTGANVGGLGSASDHPALPSAFRVSFRSIKAVEGEMLSNIPSAQIRFGREQERSLWPCHAQHSPSIRKPWALRTCHAFRATTRDVRTQHTRASGAFAPRASVEIWRSIYPVSAELVRIACRTHGLTYLASKHLGPCR